jgi:soluble lytic murein transglycosylase
MQVKLETANYMASLCGEQALVESDLFVPEINIKIGTRYFAYLFNKFENLEVSICAYNAGETVVRDWLNSSEFSADGKTLQKIPYAETQRYLKKVMFNYGVYKKMFK